MTPYRKPPKIQSSDESEHSKVCAALLALVLLFAPSPASADDAGFFTEYVEPLLKQHCYECHSHEAGEASGGLVLDSKAGWTVGGDSGPAIVPRQIEQSVLWRAVAYEDDNLQMPPEGKLANNDLTLLKKWIESGAFDPRTGGQAAQRKTVDIEAGKQWWAFQPFWSAATRRRFGSPATQPGLPTFEPRTTPRKTESGDKPLQSIVDDAIRAKLSEHQLNPVPPADRDALIRRVTYDLTGLPPNQFSLGDASYEQVVDQLLASRHFGEKWGRHWLDVARYADSNGSSFNPPFPQAWRYRNWVIESLNADLPIDRFLQMQIAGDLLPYETQQQRDDNLIATGYLLLGSKVLGTFDKEQLTLDVIDEQLDTIGKSLLGMTLGCARCHDHKFDPIPQRDYYALAGIFGSTLTLDDRLGGPKEDESDWSRRGLGADGDERLRTFLSEHRYLWIKATSRRFQAAKKVDELAAALAAASDHDESLDKELTAARAELAKADATLAEFRSQLPPYAMAVRDQAEPGDVALRIRGVAASHGDVVPRGFLQVASFDGQPEVDPSASGRLEFAQWLTSPHNPLTARVFVNRVWKHLFREGLVRSVDNFGTTGEQPTHPQLLDELAAQFIANDWQLKPLVRELVLSQTYRQAVGTPPPSDPENRLLSCQHRRRLDPEEIRDTLLVLSGRLDATPGEAMLDALPISDVSNLGDYLKIQDNRRTVYQPVIRTLEPDVLQLFDSANNAMVTGARPKTVVAPQALYFLNSSFVQSSAERITATRFQDIPSDANLPDVVDRAFAWIVSRQPTDEERRLLVEYLRRQADGPPGLTQHDVMKLCQTILGSTQFQFVE